MAWNKNNRLFKMLGVSVIAISTAVMPLNLPVSAQALAPGVGGEREGIYENDNDFDWGWLGLLGLLGLAGKGRRNNDATAYREPDTVRTGYRDQ
jgi:hypothetical protein